MGIPTDVYCGYGNPGNNESKTIRPLSSTSSFSNDTVRFTNFFVYNGDRICLNESIFVFFGRGGIRVFPLLVLPKKTYAYIHSYCVFECLCIVANVNKCTETTSGSQRHCVT